MGVLEGAVTIYLTMGVAIAVLMGLGAARVGIKMLVLEREIDPRYALVAILMVSALMWPVVVWLIVVGRRRERQAAASSTASVGP
jgi:hypothetical protein